MAFMNTIFGASAMSNNQPPAIDRQFREAVARICHLSASNRQGIDAPDSFFSHGAPAPCVSIFRRFLVTSSGSPGTARQLSESRELPQIFGKSVNAASRDVDSPRGAMPRLDAAANGRKRARHPPRHDHTVLAVGCWRLTVGHCRRRKKIPDHSGEGIFLMRRPKNRDLAALRRYML